MRRQNEDSISSSFHSRYHCAVPVEGFMVVDVDVDVETKGDWLQVM
jgi:hypothetical protein